MLTPTAPRPARRKPFLRHTLPLAIALVVTLPGCGGRTGSRLPIAAAVAPRPTAGPLVLASPDARWFTERGSGRTVLLSGSHTWNTFQDWGLTDPPPELDYPAFLQFLTAHGHNFFRLYVWEQAAWFPGTAAKVVIAPLPYLRTGPGRALDGGLRFDLTRFNPEYFRRLHERVRAAGARGVYVSVMLFDGWSIELKGQKTGNPWRGHPFNRSNNINGLDGDSNGDGEGREVHTLADSSVTALQKAYVAKVVETLGDLDNVLWEISNESRSESAEWEYAMVRTVHALEAARGTPHPVGMTSAWPHGDLGNAPLFSGPADWVSPDDTPADPYMQDPPASTSRGKLVLTDTDHLWGVGGSPGWVWKSFFRGLNPIFMDPYDTPLRDKLPAWSAGSAGKPSALVPLAEWEPVRVALGFVQAVAARTHLADLRPLGTLASSGYCLAAPGREYLAYLPARAGRLHRLLAAMAPPAFHERVTLDLTSCTGALAVEWIDPARGLVQSSAAVAGGARRELHAPFAGDAIVHLCSALRDAARPVSAR